MNKKKKKLFGNDHLRMEQLTHHRITAIFNRFQIEIDNAL